MNAKQPKIKPVITYAGMEAYPEVANGRIAVGQISNECLMGPMAVLEEPEPIKKAKKLRKKK